MKYEAEEQYRLVQKSLANSVDEVFAKPGSEDNPRLAVVKVRDKTDSGRPALQTSSGQEWEVV